MPDGQNPTPQVCDLWTFEEEGRIAGLVRLVGSAPPARMPGAEGP